MENLKIPAGRLFADSAYQRPISDADIKHYLKNFNPYLVNAVRVSERPDGMYAIIDGQHTVKLLQKYTGDDNVAVDCIVLSGLTLEQEAEMFRTINTSRKAISYNDKLRARLAEKETSAVDYLFMLERFGVDYSFSNGSSSKDKLNCHSTCESMLKKYGVEVMEHALRLCKMMSSQNKYGSGTVKVVTLIVYYYGFTFDYPRMARVMSNDRIRSGLMTAGSAHDGYRSSIFVVRDAIDIYNRGLKKNRLDPSIIASK